MANAIAEHLEQVFPKLSDLQIARIALIAERRPVQAGAILFEQGVLQASIIVFVLAGSSAPAPLYAVYQTAWGFSPVVITIVFGRAPVPLAVAGGAAGSGHDTDDAGRRGTS